jgi:sulfate permease, SulP family
LPGRDARASVAARIRAGPVNVWLEAGAVVYRISGAFFFGAAAAVSSALDGIGEHPKVFVLDFSDVPLVDSTAGKALEGRFAPRRRSTRACPTVAAGAQSVRRALLLAGLRKPLVRYASTAGDALAHWRSVSEAQPQPHA